MNGEVCIQGSSATKRFIMSDHELFGRAVDLMANKNFQRAHSMLMQLLIRHPNRESVLTNILVCCQHLPEENLAATIKSFAGNGSTLNIQQSIALLNQTLSSVKIIESSLLEALLVVDSNALQQMKLSSNFLPNVLVSTKSMGAKYKTLPENLKSKLIDGLFCLAALIANSEQADLLAEAIYLFGAQATNNETRLAFQNDLCVLYERKNTFDKLVRYFEKECILATLSDRAISAVCNGYIAIEDYSKAENIIEALQKQTNNFSADFPHTNTCKFLIQMRMQPERVTNEALNLFLNTRGIKESQSGLSILASRHYANGEYESCIELNSRILKSDSSNKIALNYLACSLIHLGEVNRGMATIDHLRKMYGDDELSFTGLKNFGIACLNQKLFDQGFSYYEFRKKPNGWGSLDYSKVISNAQKLGPNHTANEVTGLVILQEQGIGDILLGSRFMENLLQRYDKASIYMICEKRLTDVLKRISPSITFIPIESVERREITIPSFTHYTFLWSIPAAIKLDHIPDCKTYPTNAGTTRALDHCAGICWASNNKSIGSLKSASLDDVVNFALTNGARRIVNLQYGTSQAVEFNEFAEVHRDIELIDLGLDLTNDLVGICNYLATESVQVLGTSNSLFHLAGICGSRSRVLVPRNSRAGMWYWNHTTDDGMSLWYPNTEIIDIQTIKKAAR